MNIYNVLFDCEVHAPCGCMEGEKRSMAVRAENEQDAVQIAKRSIMQLDAEVRSSFDLFMQPVIQVNVPGGATLLYSKFHIEK